MDDALVNLSVMSLFYAFFVTTSNSNWSVFSDLGPVQQQTNFPELIQDEDVSHHWCHSHDIWSLLVILQLHVSNSITIHPHSMIFVPQSYL